MKKTCACAVIASLLLVCAASVGLTGCKTENMSGGMPDNTTLEFWITENVEGVDLSGHDKIAGWFGAEEYLGSNYGKTVSRLSLPGAKTALGILSPNWS